MIIGHLLQVVHANPCYDLQLLEAHADGLAALERQLVQMLDGTHPRQAGIGAIVEEADYHERLLSYVRDYRTNPKVRAPVRDNVRADPHWAPIERTFGTLPDTMAYFAKMPRTPGHAAHHLRTTVSFPIELAADDTPPKCSPSIGHDSEQQSEPLDDDIDQGQHPED